MQIAIDGPASAGKSTVAKKLAHNLNYMYLDTGAMYRGVTLEFLKDDIDLTNEELISQKLKNINLTFETVDNQQHILINGVDKGQEIRSVAVTNLVSDVASIKQVREFLVAEQRRIAGKHNVVMDGRDIGTTVLPNAEVKVFMLASVEERAQRRLLDYQRSGEEISLSQIEKDIKSRDYKDQHRAISPLVKATDAVELDTTSLSIDEVVEKLKKIIEKR
ncbi:(d)CMP kinase [Holzapfeliella floricola]|uniref:Cytidylate kinase n=1 Tax=Holzapfeliella floricola DSM 23037 = JCM 16512 TaxID=1423744 RepID=A0A0R2DS01_9LACO|nr:(d)CMP kinase [Holzapfeliella floricola]KRN03655.1 cytidylate kinase [Holzapfeliella floricola DSM 23037 = JCM 16512]